MYYSEINPHKAVNVTKIDVRNDVPVMLVAYSHGATIG